MPASSAPLPAGSRRRHRPRPHAGGGGKVNDPSPRRQKLRAIKSDKFYDKGGERLSLLFPAQYARVSAPHFTRFSHLPFTIGADTEPEW
jgi:hypothetical protein